jgi:hypothetical protein
MKVNDWLSRFGAKRRVIDRALLAECERAIGLEESAGPPPAKTSQGPSAINFEANRAAIAKAFDLLNQGDWEKPVDRDKS